MAASGLAGVLVMGLTQFNTLLTASVSGQSSLSPGFCDTKLGEEEAVDVLEGRAAVQTNSLGHGLARLA